MVLAAGFTSGVAQAQPPENPPCDTPAGEHNPLCQDGEGPPPADPPCDTPAGEHNPLCPDGPPPQDPPCDTPAGEHNPRCEDDNGENGEEGCPPAGPVTGVLVTVADEWEAGGGPAEVSDLLVQIACGVHDATGL
ncbi:MAG: hypothetical protein GEU97_15920 [Actinophytocola sp.]|nr:hypothetical protein [Actinophytocola sp.]